MPQDRRSKPPAWWLPLIIPGLQGLEENPLYLRLSRRAFVRRPTLFRSAKLQEFSHPPGSFFSGLGFPLLLWLGPQILRIGIYASMRSSMTTGAPTAGLTAAIFGIEAILSLVSVVGFFMLVARAASRGGPGVRLFLENAARLPWGEDLYLSRLRREEIDHALLAALIEKIARDLFTLVAVLAILPAGAVFFVWGLVNPGPQVIPAIGTYIRWAIPLGLALYAELFLLQVWNIVSQANSALSVAKADWAARFGESLVRAFLFGAVHLPGGCLVFGLLWALDVGWFRLGDPHSEMGWWLGWVISTALFVYPSALIGLFVCRGLLESAPGRIGEAMGVAIRRRCGD